MTLAKLFGIACFIWVIVSFKSGRLAFGVAQLTKAAHPKAYWVALTGLAVLAAFLSFWQ